MLAHFRQETDLESLTHALSRAFAGTPPVGYLNGRTRIRDEVMTLYRCSAVRAELLVDQLQARGFIRYDGNPRTIRGKREVWRFTPRPASAS